MTVWIVYRDYGGQEGTVVLFVYDNEAAAADQVEALEARYGAIPEHYALEHELLSAFIPVR